MNWKVPTEQISHSENKQYDVGYYDGGQWNWVFRGVDKNLARKVLRDLRDPSSELYDELGLTESHGPAEIVKR